MSRRKYHNKQVDTTLNDINKGVQTLVENSNKEIEKIDNIKSNTDTLVKNSNSKFPNILAIIGIVVTIIVSIVPIVISISNTPTASTSDGSTATTDEPAYEIYLYPDYKKLKVYAKTDITASLNFDTDSVNIDAYLNSVHNGDTVIMTQKNSSEWQAKVYFTETGIFEVVATATAPDGTSIEGVVEIEVVPIYE